MPPALAEALKDFGSREMPARQARPSPSMPAASAPLPADEQPVRLALEIAKAEAALAERLESAHAAALQEERARHQAAEEELHRRYGDEFGRRLADEIAGMQEAVAEVTTDIVARILAAALSQQLQHRAVESLRAAVAEALRETDLVRIRVSGPLSLFETMQQGLGPLADRLDFTEIDSPDLTVTIDGHVIETRLGEWAAALAEVMA